MDDRQAQLIAAAEALRTWIYAQRATWSDPLLLVAPPASCVSLPAPIFANVAPGCIDRVVPPPVPSISLVVVTETALDRFRAASALSAARILASWAAVIPVVRRSWRVELAALLLIAGVWTVRVHGANWTSTVATQWATGRQAVADARREAASRPIDKTAVQRTVGASRVETGRNRTGRLQVESDPPGAHVIIDGRDRGVTPLTVEDLTAGTHGVELRADGGSVQRTVTIAAAKTTQLTEAIYSGWLHVSSPIELQISEGTRGIKLDDRNQALLSPGSHDVVFQNRAFGFREVRRVEVRPGDTSSIVVEPPPSPLSINASEPARVTIDGEAIGETPLADYPVKLGMRDIAVTSASGAVRRITLTMTVKPSRVDVDFSKP